MKYIDELVLKALEDEYLHELFFKIEQLQAKTFFQIFEFFSKKQTQRNIKETHSCE